MTGAMPNLQISCSGIHCSSRVTAYLFHPLLFEMLTLKATSSAGYLNANTSNNVYIYILYFQDFSSLKERYFIRNMTPKCKVINNTK